VGPSGALTTCSLTASTRAGYRWDQLYKTEKTHFGTLVEINLQREFGFADGRDHGLLRSRASTVDCKYAQNIAEWMIPARGHGTCRTRPVG